MPKLRVPRKTRKAWRKPDGRMLPREMQRLRRCYRWLNRLPLEEYKTIAVKLMEGM